MSTVINQDEQAVVESIQTIGRASTSTGVKVDTVGNGVGDTPYCTKALPVKGFEGISPVGSPVDAAVRDGLRAMAIPLVQTMKPILLHNEIMGVSGGISFSTTNQNLCAITIPVSSIPTIARQVMIQVDFSAFVSISGTTLKSWVTIDSALSSYKYFVFNEANSHKSVTANWVMTLPVGANTVTLWAVRSSGTGTFSLDAGDCVQMTVIG